MYQHIIGNKRASLSPAQRPRNGFCSTSGRRETRASHGWSSSRGPGPGKGSDFDPDSSCVRIHVGLRRPHPQMLDSAERRRSARTPHGPASPGDCSAGPTRAPRPRCAGSRSSRRAAGRRRAAACRSSSQISTVTSRRCGAPTSNSWNPMSASTSSESSRIRAERTLRRVGHEAGQLRLAHDSPGTARRARGRGSAGRNRSPASGR